MYARYKPYIPHGPQGKQFFNWGGYRVPYGCTPLNSEEFMRRAVYHKVYVLILFCKTKIWGPFIWGIV